MTRNRLPTLSRAIAMLADPSGLDGAELELKRRTDLLYEELPGVVSPVGSPNRMFIPWEMLRPSRDLNVSGAAATIPTRPQPTADILRAESIALQLGVQIVDGLVGTVTFPRTSVKSAPAWMSTETSSASNSDPNIASTSCTPHILIGTFQVSRQLYRQIPLLGDLVNRELARTAGDMFDAAALSGPGTGGAPTGVNNMSGLGTQSGTSLSWAGVWHMRKLALDANAGGAAFVTTPAVAEILATRERASGSGYIWESMQPGAFVSTLMPSATMIAGPWSSLVLALWGSGVVVESNPFDVDLFKSGIVQWRVIVGCDVALTCAPAAFTKSSSIS
jgi:hypothetical protein